MTDTRDVRLVADITFDAEPGFEPGRATDGSAGFDLRAKLADGRNEIHLHDGAQALIGTGVRVAIPPSHVGLVFIRSSVGAKLGISLLNGVGVIDSDYRGEIRLALVGHGSLEGKTPAIVYGDRVAQLVVVPIPQLTVAFGKLDETARGEGGFGSTGRS